MTVVSVDPVKGSAYMYDATEITVAEKSRWMDCVQRNELFQWKLYLIVEKQEVGFPQDMDWQAR